ncbi:thiopeptide-type bacteriocin biosynthesis protein [Micromonospora aurantiaca (nom. illeg.)]|uniref:thiopeptide-type bacteriocin biosynthesis protein n=2 Tax=Micromonospora TaxID=1873 RepID=UPI000673D64A|nr:thiopeptide-type bacteriocin biosynthesis protein [Micromonospora aurantiaca]
MAALVEAVLAGTPMATAAAGADVDVDDLDAAVQTYRTAGLTALQRRHDDTWQQALIRPIDWNTAEAVFRSSLAPHLDRLGGGQAGWWFLRKHPYWRFRIRAAHHGAVRALLDDLTADGVTAGWKPGIYEPETAAFGGDTSTAIVHELFCADSRAVLNYTRHHAPLIGRRELSVLLIRTLQHHAGLDWYEAADMFDQVAQMRPVPAAADATRIDRLAAQMRPLLALPANARTAMFTPGGPLSDASGWQAAFAAAGQQLADATHAGRLRRGIRAVLAQIVIFHWNRLDLPAHAQGILAHAATAAILPRS